MTRLDKIRADFAKIGTDKNLKIGDFGIYHLAGFLGVLTYLVSKSGIFVFPSSMHAPWPEPQVECSLRMAFRACLIRKKPHALCRHSHFSHNQFFLLQLRPSDG